VPEPRVPRPHRVYPEQQVALALGIKIGSLRERIERGASLRGWAPDDPGNPLGVWLVDADYADANEPRVAGAAIPSFAGPLPPLGPPARHRRVGSGGVGNDPLEDKGVQLELARAETAVEREGRLSAQLADRTRQLEQSQRDVRKLRALLVTSQEALVAAHKHADTILAAEVVSFGEDQDDGSA
jgi:hypothetical protein